MRWVLEKSIEYLWSVLDSVLEAEDKKDKYQIFLGEVCSQLESLKKKKTLEMLTSEWNLKVWTKVIQLSNRKMRTQGRYNSMDKGIKA